MSCRISRHSPAPRSFSRVRTSCIPRASRARSRRCAVATSAFDVAAERHAAARCASLAHVVRARRIPNRRCFTRADSRTSGCSAIVDRLGFHTAEDAGAIGGNVESSFGVDEPAAVARMLSLDRLAEARAALLHHLPAGRRPSSLRLTGSGRRFRSRPRPTHYRNALLYGDRSLRIADLDGLHARGLADDTLLVAFGDHGEAFGRACQATSVTRCSSTTRTSACR